MLIRAFVGCAALSCPVGCGAGSDSQSANLPGPSGVPDASIAETASAFAASANASTDVKVNMQDACDPDTFNAVLGAGARVRNGGVKFDDFISQLTKLGFVGSWHFAPNMVNARTGERFLVVNRGGEVPTFTEVDEFGGGIVDDLNELSHLPTVAPECLSLEPDDLVAPGQTYEEDIEEAGEEKYQCCIHPWMRLNARVSEAPGRR